MIKTIPKSIKVLCSFVLAMIIAGVGWKLLAASLLTYADKTANYISEVLQIPPPLEKIQTVFTWAYFALCVILYVLIVLAVQRFTSWLWTQRLARVGLKNPQGETPRLRAIKKHAIKGWIVYRFIPFGFSKDDFSNKAGRLAGVFRGKIGQISLARNMKYIEVEVLPWQKIVPAIFQLFDSTERRQDLMNVLGFASLVVGAPNGGKTYTMLTLAANYAAEGYTIIWLNRKGADVDEFRECANYFEADEVAAGWKILFERLRLREQHEENETEKKQKFLLVFDEYQSHVARLGKEKTTFLQEFMSYIALSRSLKFVTLVGTQAAYSEDMPKGARDMFANIVMMGNLAKTAKSMYLETDMIEQVTPVRQQGGGNIYHAADNSIEPLQVAPMVDETAIMRMIADALNRPTFLPQGGADDILNTP